MTSFQPHLIRALLEWIGDNGCTPHMAVWADTDGVAVPSRHVRDGRVVLNVSAKATRNFHLDDATVEFDARFDGRLFHVVVPLEAVAGVYAKENGEGMSFGVEAPAKASASAAVERPERGPGAPALKLVE